jgi:hypothetical protein
MERERERERDVRNCRLYRNIWEERYKLFGDGVER